MIAVMRLVLQRSFPSRRQRRSGHRPPPAEADGPVPDARVLQHQWRRRRRPGAAEDGPFGQAGAQQQVERAGAGARSATTCGCCAGSRSWWSIGVEAARWTTAVAVAGGSPGPGIAGAVPGRCGWCLQYPRVHGNR